MKDYKKLLEDLDKYTRLLVVSCAIVDGRFTLEGTSDNMDEDKRKFIDEVINYIRHECLSVYCVGMIQAVLCELSANESVNDIEKTYNINLREPILHTLKIVEALMGITLSSLGTVICMRDEHIYYWDVVDVDIEENMGLFLNFICNEINSLAVLTIIEITCYLTIETGYAYSSFFTAACISQHLYDYGVDNQFIEFARNRAVENLEFTCRKMEEVGKSKQLKELKEYAKKQYWSAPRLHWSVNVLIEQMQLYVNGSVNDGKDAQLCSSLYSSLVDNFGSIDDERATILALMEDYD